MGWETFVTLDTDFIYLRLIHMFFANVIIDEHILAITCFVKGRMIIIGKQYLNDQLNLSLPGLRVFSGNKLVTTLPSIIKQVQLDIMFGDEYADYENLPPYSYLSKESYVLHNMFTQIIIPRTKQRSKMLYMDLWIACILRVEKIN